MSSTQVSDGAFVFWMLFVITLVGSLIMLAIEDAEGAGTPMWEPQIGMIDESPLGGYGNGHAARGPDNIVRRVWQDDDYSIKVSYTDDNGSTWPVSTVINSAWKGHTNSVIGGIVVLANNTTIIHFIANNADDNYNTYVACRWNWSGSWDIIKVYGDAISGMGWPKMAVNETVVLLTYVTGGNTLRWKLFDPDDSTVTPPAPTIPEIWLGSWDHASEYDITVNQSGYFIICAKSWSGSSYRFYVRDLDLIEAVIYADYSSGTFDMYAPTIMCTTDDTFIIGASLYWSGGSQEGIVIFYQATPWSGFTKRNIGLSGQLDVYDWYSLGSCIDDDDRVTFYWANDTGPGGDVHISKMTAIYTATEATWEGVIINRVYNYGTDDDFWTHTDWYDGIFPIVGGYSVNIPNSGWMGHHTWMDEVGSPDDYAFALYWNASFHWYDWAPPAGPGPGPGGDGDLFSGEDGDPWYIPASLMADLWILFIVTAMFVGVATAFRKYTDSLKGWQYSQRRYARYRKPIYSGYKKRRTPKPRSKYRYRY